MASTLQDRAAARRAALIEAGVELLGTVGAAGVTVRAVCRGAKLTERYFYESFDSRDALLRAVHAQVAEAARETIVAAVASAAPHTPERVAQAAVAAFTAFLEADPRRGRVLLSESFTDSVLAQHDLELIPAFAALLVTQIRALPDPPDDVDAQLTAVALLGALRTLYLTWLQDDPSIPAARLNAHATALVLAAAEIRSGHAAS
ncbi:MAG TPA: helix-turn-helix domain-containing protein [Baekduia sp.]|uniref:TetR/AcrR family transcriptional regulator n=1 Tax=Baekduia sp. TaxID=2600305 RepID=UPI002D782740|nr:helix-turn-helix domain-containing protein [Baekduia sp.]HET6508670.1 helix-turn-helix domain-containing protein [Baekduia sp.]